MLTDRSWPKADLGFRRFHLIRCPLLARSGYRNTIPPLSCSQLPLPPRLCLIYNVVVHSGVRNYKGSAKLTASRV